jgi:endoglucanase
MKRVLCYAVAISTLLICFSSCQNQKAVKETDPFSNATFKIKKGTNVGHWLSQSKARGEQREKFFTERDVKYIDSLGFDHIRLPIDEEQMWDETGRRNEDAFTLMKNCLDWCRKAGLRVIIDLHILRSHYFNADVKPLWSVPAEQDKFIAFWKDLSSFIKDYPTAMVAYEPMNEPVADDPEQWNQLLGRLVDSVRKWEPARVLVLGSNQWQSANTFDQLRIPEGDTNLILSYHFYEPFFLTHYQAGWTPLKEFKGDVNYPGQIVTNAVIPESMKKQYGPALEDALRKVYNRDTLAFMMRKPFEAARRTKLQLYCGEFGVFRNYFPEAKLAWYKDMVSIFREHDVAYANWNYKSGSFGIVDENNIPDMDVTNILLGKE